MNVKIKGFKFVLSKHINKGIFTIYFGLFINEDYNDSELCFDFKNTFNSLSSLFKDLMLHFEKGIISFSLNN